MAGLLEKDFRLMLKRKNYFLMTLAIALFLSFSTDGSFVIMYVAMLGAMIALSTISYDEFDNGYPFLMSLPVTPGQYAVEKYVLSAITGFVTLILAVVVYVVSNVLKGGVFFEMDILYVLASAVVLFAFMISLLIPMELKFGAEKGRIALILFFGIIGVIVLLGTKAAQAMGVDVTSMLEKFTTLNDAIVIGILVAVVVLVVSVSMMISVGVMQKKEF